MMETFLPMLRSTKPIAEIGYNSCIGVSSMSGSLSAWPRTSTTPSTSANDSTGSDEDAKLKMNTTSDEDHVAGKSVWLEKLTSPDLDLETLDEIADAFVKAAGEGRHKSEGFPGTAYGTSKTLMTQLHRVLA